MKIILSGLLAIAALFASLSYALSQPDRPVKPLYPSTEALKAGAINFYQYKDSGLACYENVVEQAKDFWPVLACDFQDFYARNPELLTTTPTEDYVEWYELNGQLLPCMTVARWSGRACDWLAYHQNIQDDFFDASAVDVDDKVNPTSVTYRNSEIACLHISENRSTGKYSHDTYSFLSCDFEEFYSRNAALLANPVTDNDSYTTAFAFQANRLLPCLSSSLGIACDFTRFYQANKGLVEPALLTPEGLQLPQLAAR